MLKILKLKQWIKKILQLDLHKKNYVSELDHFLKNLGKTNTPKSVSQLKEIIKHKKIFELRDKKQ